MARTTKTTAAPAAKTAKEMVNSAIAAAAIAPAPAPVSTGDDEFDAFFNTVKLAPIARRPEPNRVQFDFEVWYDAGWNARADEVPLLTGFTRPDGPSREFWYDGWHAADAAAAAIQDADNRRVDELFTTYPELKKLFDEIAELMGDVFDTGRTNGRCTILKHKFIKFADTMTEQDRNDAARLKIIW